jgi:hypothetical protein
MRYKSNKPIRTENIGIKLYPWQVEALKQLDLSGRPCTAAYRIVEKAIEEYQKTVASNERK